jgi:cbb3-type cytochrome c oxidase subunit II
MSSANPISASPSAASKRASPILAGTSPSTTGTASSRPEPRGFLRGVVERPLYFSSWRGIALVAITYSYFLIFAQFAFLQRLTQLHIADAHLKAVMAAMALGGILFSLLTPRTEILTAPPARLRAALTLCAAAALLTLLPLNLPAAIATAVLIGAALGTLTVTLVTHLSLWIGTTNPLLKVGIGTGLGYLICNFPPLFTASAQTQAATAAGLCLVAIFVTSGPRWDSSVISTEAGQSHRPAQWRDPQLRPTAALRRHPEAQPKDPRISPAAESSGTTTFPQVLLAFTALIWLDSAAFFIIQSTPALKANTWQGTTHLYLNGTLHLLAALASVYLLRRRGLRTTLAAALLFLAAACLLLLDPHRAALASLVYPIGVSLYSVALVAYPAFLSPATTLAQRARQAGLLYAIGGWFGSAMGIGMGQHLGHIPTLFVLAAATLILAPQLLQTRRRELLATTALVLIAAAAWATQKSHTPVPTLLTQVERGRQVYIAEGCINCHSQYVRPDTPDILLWGPVQTLADLRAQRPPLIGNRRQGPDLSEVAARRSPLWLRAHFYEPSQISHGSIMPTFAPMFRTQQGSDTRGDDLIAYLETLHPTPTAASQHRAAELSWQPNFAAATASHGQQLYNQECATCHNANGATRTQWRTSFHRLPAILSTGPYFDVRPSTTPVQLAQIIKFGIPHTDMAGHEYLSDADIASLTLYLQQIIAQPQPTATNTSQGDTR